LHNGNANHDEEEHPGVEEVLENVELLGADNAAIPLVPPGKLHEGVEDDCQVSLLGNGSGGKLTVNTLGSLGSVGVFQVEDSLAAEDDDAHDNDIPEGDAIDLAPDDLLKDGVSLSDGRFIQDGGHGVHGGQGESSESVNDQVDPQELSRADGRLSQVQVTDENGDENREVASDLELQETLDVGVNVTAEHNSVHAIKEVVIGQDNIALLLGDRGSGAHAEADMRCAERFDVVVAVTNNCSLLASGLKTSGQKEFIIRGSTSQDNQVVNFLLEGILVNRGENNLAIFVLHLFEATASVSKLGGFHGVAKSGLVVHGHVVLGEEAAVDGLGNGGLKGVVGDDAHVELSALGTAHGFLHLVTEGVLHGHEADEGVVSGELVSAALIEEVVGFLLQGVEVLLRHIFVGETEGAEALGAHSFFHHGQHGCFFVIFKRGLFTVFVVLVGAVRQDALGGTFDIHANSVLHVGVADSDNGSLGNGVERNASNFVLGAVLAVVMHLELGFLEPSHVTTLGVVTNGHVEGVLVEFHVDFGVP